MLGQEASLTGRGTMTQTDSSEWLRAGFTMEDDLSFPEVDRRIGLAFATTGGLHRVTAFYLHEIDERGLHQIAGYRSAVQYAVQRHGMSRREARDLLAAGRALQELPEIDGAFAEGRLCWSKVRELVKVATPQHEQRWLAKADELSIEELALEVKLARPGEPPRDRELRLRSRNERLQPRLRRPA